MPGIDRLIVGASGSPGSLVALRYGEVLARAYDAVLIPVLAWELPGGEHAVRVQPSGDLRQEWRNLAPPAAAGRPDRGVGRGPPRPAGAAAPRAGPSEEVRKP